MTQDNLRIAILGAGGVGSLYGGTLARAGFPVAFLARGAHLEALQARGLEVRTPTETFTVSVRAAATAEELGPVDLAIVAVKCYSLDGIVPAAKLLATRGATILPFLNGVEAADRLIAGGVPRESVLGGLTQVSTARVAPGAVQRKSAFQKVTVGELAGGLSARAERVAAAFRAAGADASASADIQADLWRKLAFIAAMAAACGLARAPVGPVKRAPYGPLLLTRAVAEVFAVAQARGIGIGEHDEEKTLRFIESLAEGLKPSFLLDLEAGGPNELDDLSGAVARLGREVGVATPIHDTAVAALSAARTRP